MNAKNQLAFLGLDIGGANIKISNGADFHHHEPFALWQSPDKLSQTLRQLIEASPSACALAITMTGELTDCFENKKQGVGFIADHAAQASELPLYIYLVDGRFVDRETAKQEYSMAAASNWHALAKFVAREMAGGQSGLLIDIGSTTTDVIPFTRGDVVSAGQDDYGRLEHRELVYTGSIRSNLAGILLNVSHRGQQCPVMNEMFATTLDTNILLGHFEPGHPEYYTADGLGTDHADCIRRIARLIGKDDLTFDRADALEIAMQVYAAQTGQISSAIQTVLKTRNLTQPQIFVSGQGEFLAYDAANAACQGLQGSSINRLSERLGTAGSSCATAFAISRLAKAWSSDSMQTDVEVTT